MREGKLKIHSENILPIIKKWLYSDRDIFVRELVSNACDALHKLEKLGCKAEEPRIEIVVDKEKKTLSFSDNGIGMNAEEVEKYIAQIAFSGAEEFVKKYEKEMDGEQMIGHFGLGFYSSYMVATQVEIQTLSHREGEKPVFWSCDGSTSYSIDKGTRESQGTEIVLHLEDEEFCDEALLRGILQRYCTFLPYPILLNGSRINETDPLWIKNSHECTEQEYTKFYQKLFPMEQEPLFWIHLNVDFPFHLKGILYFPKITQESELKKDGIRLFCNRVFVSDNCRDLLPDYLTILRGAIDSPDIPLNVSRSYLQMDSTVRKLSAHISKKIADRLGALHTSEREKFLSYWPDIELIVKYGALQDDKFYERVKPFLIWKSVEGEWLTCEEVIERTQDKTIYYTADEHSPLLQMYEGKTILHIRPTMIDNALLQMLEGKTDATFKRLDGEIDEHLLDASKEKSVLDSDGRPASAKIADFFKSKLDCEVEAKSLAQESVPAFLLLKEEERRLRDALVMHNKKGALPFKPTLVINTNNTVIEKIQTIHEKDPDLATKLAQHVYDLASLSQRELDPEKLSEFVARSNEVLAKLVQ